MVVGEGDVGFHADGFEHGAEKQGLVLAVAAPGLEGGERILDKLHAVVRVGDIVDLVADIIKDGPGFLDIVVVGVGYGADGQDVDLPVAVVDAREVAHVVSGEHQVDHVLDWAELEADGSALPEGVLEIHPPL